MSQAFFFTTQYCATILPISQPPNTQIESPDFDHSVSVTRLDVMMITPSHSAACKGFLLLTAMAHEPQAHALGRPATNAKAI